MTEDEVLAIVRQCWAKYTWVPLLDSDPGLSFGDAVLAGLPWSGNCKNMAFTIQDLVSRQTGAAGLPFQWACRVNTPRGWHWIFVMAPSDAARVVCGDTEKPGVMIYALSDCNYSFVEFASMDSGDPLIYTTGAP